jgi:acyl-coenzyme A synthetase/AMP-(fatty) acid ligase
MIFWIEENIEITYSQLFEDINGADHNTNLTGYSYFLSLLIKLCKGVTIHSIEDLIRHLEENKNKLSFRIDTSGTTSIPRSLEVRMSNCIRHVKTTNKNKSIWGMGYPCGSYASTQVFFQSLINQETIIYLFGLDFKNADKLFSRYGITNLCCTPTFLSMLLMNLKQIYPTVKKISSGGEKIKDHLIQALKKTFTSAEYINIYASTETGSLLRSTSEFFSIPEKYKSQIKIENGTLRVHKSLLNEVDQIDEGWYDTNDVVEFINETQFRFISRSNGYLNTGGFRVSPSEIEDNLISIDGVVDAHVYGKSNNLLGTIICADIMSEKLTSKMIKLEMAKKFTEKHKIPRVIRLVESFEHISNGKRKIMI